ncbi:MAG: permease [Clostridia bacterium]|nr:permease [Clostridia bacterium]NCC43735.1 permease [Clostridia bacterium]
MTLLRMQLLSRSGINAFRYEKDRKKKNRTLMVGIAVGIAIAVMIGYCFAIGYGLGYLGLAEVIPGYALTITGIVNLMFTFIKTNGFLFAYRDYDLLMALPYRTETIITVKFLYMYIYNLLFTLAVMIPMGISYAYWSHVSVSGCLMWAIGMIIAPLLPMTIAAAAGALIAAVGSRFHAKVFVQVILFVILILAVFGLSFGTKNMAMKDEAGLLLKISDMGTVISAQLHKIYPLSSWFDTAINNNDILIFLLLPVVSVLWYGIFIWILGKYYKKINTALMTYHAESRYEMAGLKTNTIMGALIKKEAKRFFSSVIYLMNTGIGLIMALIAAIVCMVAGFDKILELLEIPGMEAGFVYIVPFAVAMVVNMSCTTSVSWSLEGKNKWIVDSLPISRKVLFQSKMAFNMILVLPVSFVCSIIFMVNLRVTVIQGMLYLLIAVVTSSLSTVWGMWINIRFPNFSWENEVEVIKQGMSSMLGIFGSLVGYLVIGFVVYVLCAKIPGEVVLAVMVAFLGGASAVLYHLVMANADSK